MRHRWGRPSSAPSRKVRIESEIEGECDRPATRLEPGERTSALVGHKMANGFRLFLIFYVPSMRFMRRFFSSNFLLALDRYHARSRPHTQPKIILNAILKPKTVHCHQSTASGFHLSDLRYRIARNIFTAPPLMSLQLWPRIMQFCGSSFKARARSLSGDWAFGILRGKMPGR